LALAVRNQPLDVLEYPAWTVWLHVASVTLTWSALVWSWVAAGRSDRVAVATDAEALAPRARASPPRSDAVRSGNRTATKPFGQLERVRRGAIP